MRWPPTDPRTAFPDPRPVVRSLEGGARERLEALVAALAFWCAVALPGLYLGLLASGLDSTAELQAFLGLLALHLLALLGGRHHRTTAVAGRTERAGDRAPHAD